MYMPPGTQHIQLYINGLILRSLTANTNPPIKIKILASTTANELKIPATALTIRSNNHLLLSLLVNRTYKAIYVIGISKLAAIDLPCQVLVNKKVSEVYIDMRPKTINNSINKTKYGSISLR